MRAIVVDPASREIRDQELDGGLKSLQSVVGGYIEAVYPEDWVPALAGHHIYVNEEGRLLPELAVQRWSLKDWPEEWLCGPAILLCDNGHGGEAPATVSLEKVRELVAFV